MGVPTGHPPFIASLSVEPLHTAPGRAGRATALPCWVAGTFTFWPRFPLPLGGNTVSTHRAGPQSERSLRVTPGVQMALHPGSCQLVLNVGLQGTPNSQTHLGKERPRWGSHFPIPAVLKSYSPQNSGSGVRKDDGGGTGWRGGRAQKLAHPVMVTEGGLFSKRLWHNCTFTHQRTGWTPTSQN